MHSCCVKFFNTVLSSDGHAFRALQRTINVDHARSAEEAARIAQARFETLEQVPDWRLHAHSCEVDIEN